VGKPGVAGVYTNQRLNLSKPWEDLRMTSQGFKPGSGNPTVRHYRGALGNVRHGETETPSCNRKSGNGNPSPTAGRAQFLSQPTEYGNGQSAKENEDGLEQIRKAGKTEIITLTPEQDEAMRKAMMPVYKDVASRVGQPLIDEFLKETGRSPMN